MIEKQYLVVVFSSNTEAVEAEMELSDIINVRTIPLPSDIKAGCGLALKAEVSDLEKIQEKVKSMSVYKVFVIDGIRYVEEV